MNWELLLRKIRRLENWPTARAHRLTAQAIPNTGAHIINFDTVARDPLNLITTGANWKFTIPRGHSGDYLISCHLRWAAIGIAGFMLQDAYVDGALSSRIAFYAAAAGGAGVINMGGATVVYAEEGSYIDVRATQDSASGNRNIDPNSTNYVTRVAIVRIA